MREAELMARDRWTREELLAFQRERVQALVAHAVTNSPYYREALSTDAAERPLSELPTLPKATMMAEFDRVVADSRLRLADLQAHLAGPDPSQSFLGAYRVATTSGTTGRRSIVAFTHDEAAAWRAVSPTHDAHRSWAWAAVCSARQPKPRPRHQAGARSPRRANPTDLGCHANFGVSCRAERSATRGPCRRCGRLEGVG